jgi:hypothetical protein
MTPESAIRTFDDHLVFLAKRGMINNLMLKKLSGALKVLAGQITQQEKADLELQATVNALAETNEKLTTLLKAAGFTQKAIEEVVSLRSDFLERWSEWAVKTKNLLQFSLMYDVLLFDARQIENRARGDVKNVREFYFFWRMKDKINNHEKTLRAYKTNYPHLNEWFTRIENGEDMDELFNEQQIFSESYKNYLSKWN